MNIKEAEKLSGLSSRNIRFYEQKGLLKPSRNQENDYRTYSQTDIDRLRLIRILRMLDMPLEQIREVVHGDLSLQEAALRQQEKLRRQIDKMETAARFCEELSMQADPDLQELLKRMDEPENSEKLSKKWPSDYRRSAKMVLLTLLAGLLPMLIGSLMVMPAMIAMMIGEVALFFLSLVLPVCWACLGYWFCKKGGCWRSLLLTHTVPALICALMEWQLRLPHEQRSNLLSGIGECFRFPFFFFDSKVENLEGYWPVLFILVACFCLGAFVAWIVPIFASGWKQLYQDRYHGWTAFWGLVSERVPVKLMIMFAVILLPCLMIILSLVFGPLEDQVTPEEMQQRLNQEIRVWVETEDLSYELTGSARFCRQFQFGQWERQYFPSSLKKVVLEVHLSSDRSEPHAIEFYSDGTARIYEAWVVLEEGYFYVPEGVAEAVLAYAVSVSEAEDELE